MPRISVDLYLCLVLSCLMGTVSSSANSHTLRLVTQDFPPFSYLDKGKVAGPAAELVRLVCKEMSVQCELDLLPWRRAMKSLRMGAYEGAFLIGRNQQRSTWLHYSPALISTEYGFFVSASNPLKYSRPTDINGYSVAVYGPSNTSHSLEKLSINVKGMKIVMRPDDEPGFRQLEVLRVDSVYSNRDVGKAMIKRLGIKGVRYAGVSSFTELLRWVSQAVCKFSAGWRF